MTIENATPGARIASDQTINSHLLVASRSHSVTLVAGRVGAGKTVVLHDRIRRALLTGDRQYLFDPAKGGGEAGRLGPYLDGIADDYESSVLMLRSLRADLEARRSNLDTDRSPIHIYIELIDIVLLARPQLAKWIALFVTPEAAELGFRVALTCNEYPHPNVVPVEIRDAISRTVLVLRPRTTPGEILLHNLFGDAADAAEELVTAIHETGHSGEMGWCLVQEHDGAVGFMRVGYLTASETDIWLKAKGYTEPS